MGRQICLHMTSQEKSCGALSAATSSCMSLYSACYNDDSSVSGLEVELPVAADPTSSTRRAKSELLTT